MDCGVTLLVLPPGGLLEQSSRRRRAPTPTLNVDEHFSWGHLRLKAGINKLCSSVRPCWLLSLSKAGGALPHFLRLHPCNSSPISSSGPSLWSGSLWQVPFRLAQGLGKSNQPWKAKASLGERREKLLPPRSRRLSGGGLLSVPQLCSISILIPITSLSPSHSISNSSVFYPIPSPFSFHPHTIPIRSPCHPHVPQCIVLPTSPLGSRTSRANSFAMRGDGYGAVITPPSAVGPKHTHAPHWCGAERARGGKQTSEELQKWLQKAKLKLKTETCVRIATAWLRVLPFPSHPVVGCFEGCPADASPRTSAADAKPQLMLQAEPRSHLQPWLRARAGPGCSPSRSRSTSAGRRRR